MDTPTLAEQIECVEREIGMREKVYPRWVRAIPQKLTQAKADQELARMRAVLATLKLANRPSATQEPVAQLIKLLRARWEQSARRYSKARSDWHMRMPADWPMELTLPIGLVRTLVTAPCAAPQEAPMAMLPNEYHPGPRCACRDCLAAWPQEAPINNEPRGNS